MCMRFCFTFCVHERDMLNTNLFWLQDLCHIGMAVIKVVLSSIYFPVYCWLLVCLLIIVDHFHCSDALLLFRFVVRLTTFMAKAPCWWRRRQQFLFWRGLDEYPFVSLFFEFLNEALGMFPQPSESHSCFLHVTFLTIFPFSIFASASVWHCQSLLYWWRRVLKLSVVTALSLIDDNWQV